ncbi:solute carrier family 52, riboflavin transporter, member 2 isoform X1 [Lepisosteus oculatus]|uniref:solute carrier family 52, riboflavin transporter, member 2 isoform X1 n=1 Tax=Lepisosteus oculatus TaxID=7918 RepID=UPI0007403BB2|nr:PREDICTED: solute carrier family 52, riboflavin transporter, member 2 isoform X1 [Lepisosteus oculatus]XP_015213110.1 PREDICTED: solute carrier family 52, riboflavin transporter, member 2 isoform X1 [Lepisosteus oculatus]XP_015213111.1 PREDICTED: solute carrier family 52, riboflavin transporter, member 2 isoform X1 [Lepisosteus oculatus]XP_015213113.1 PREDICTED: solute carrier family 52, riboflavin transporter, member 2 isoform X1 [Lepisosteus oculatus]
MMDCEQASSFTTDASRNVFDIADDLRDETFFKLVENFIGSQSGKRPDISRIPCNNRFLVQVGLIREENQASWSNVVKWLERLFPRYKSIDFQNLIESAIATVLRLSGKQKRAFLEENVDFEFVGPICDRLGIRRTDLLELSDFSDRVKFVRLTNGLVLELQNFIAQQKIDPSVLVCWLRNFCPQFCGDGNVVKASRFLENKLEKLKIEGQIQQKRRYRGNKFFKMEFELFPNLHGAEEQIMRSSYKKLLPKIQIKKETEGLRNQDSIQGLQEADGEYFLQNRGETERVFPKKEENPTWTLHAITENTAVLSQCLTYEQTNQEGFQDQSSTGKYCHLMERKPLTMDLEGSLNAVEVEVLTLLDVSVLAFQKLLEVYGTKTEQCNQAFGELLKEHFALMSEEDSVMKAFGERINLCRQEYFAVPSLLHFLRCNTYFLHDLSDATEKQIMCFEREITSVAGGKLGRDKNPKFANFVNFTESSSSRYIHMACDVLSHHSEAKHGCREQWLDFCQISGKTSKLTNGRSNRFINYFEGAAGLIHHHSDITTFFSEHLSRALQKPNVIQESVKDDACDHIIHTLVCVLALVYCKIIGPYWQLLKSTAEYFYFHRYVQCLHQKLDQWSVDASPMLVPEYSNTNLFQQFPLQEKCFHGVFSCCTVKNKYLPLIKKSLETIMKTFVTVIERNFKDFLPGGEYSQDPTLGVCAKLRPCQLRQLMGEYPFGHGCTNQMLQSSDVQRSFYTSQRSSEESSQVTHFQMPEKDIESKKKKMKRLQHISNKNSILAAVVKSGGPCRTKQDVDCLLSKLVGANHAQKREAIRLQISYQKVILGSKDRNLNHIGFSLKDMVEKLKMVLADEPQGTSASIERKLVTVEASGSQSKQCVVSDSLAIESSAASPGDSRASDIHHSLVQSYEDYREKMGCFVYLE